MFNIMYIIIHVYVKVKVLATQSCSTLQTSTLWPARFPCPWNSLGKNTGKKVKSLSCTQLFATPWTVACTKLLCPWDFLSKSTVVGCCFLLQGIFPIQRSNPGLLHCRQTLYRLSHQGSPTSKQRCSGTAFPTTGRAASGAHAEKVKQGHMLCRKTNGPTDARGGGQETKG